MADSAKEHFVTTITENHETTCWGCGLRLLLPTYNPVFKCGWCGAITNQNERKCDNEHIRWRRFRDHSFLCVLLGFMFFVIFGGVWAVYPVIFSISNFCGIFHSVITAILAISTITFFSLASFRCAGKPPTIQWGSYPAVGKGYLENYTFCHYCTKPKSPRSHHCRSCGTCVLDMDHHCPFIGNCVGASNHRHFVVFLISAIISIIYVTGMSVYAGLHIWPPVTLKSSGEMRAMNSNVVWKALREIVFAVLSSTVLLSTRGLVLVYLFISSVAMEIGLSVLLWQQLSYIYEGKTYLDHLSSHRSNRVGEKGCRNIFRFFGCPYPISVHTPTFFRHLPIFRNPKRHKR